MHIPLSRSGMGVGEGVVGAVRPVITIRWRGAAAGSRGPPKPSRRHSIIRATAQWKERAHPAARALCRAAGPR